MSRIPFDPYDFFGYLASGLLVAVGMELTFGFPDLLGRDFTLVESAILVLGVYVAGQMIATPAKAVLEDGLVDKLLERPSVNLFRETKPRLRPWLFPGFYKPLPEIVRKDVLARAGRDGHELNGEALFLRVRYSAEIREDENLMQRLKAFLNQYGFNRNLCFASSVVGIAVLVRATVTNEPSLFKYGILFVVSGAVLIFRYLKFFRQYSYEMFSTYGGRK